MLEQSECCKQNLTGGCGKGSEKDETGDEY